MEEPSLTQYMAKMVMMKFMGEKTKALSTAALVTTQ